MGARKIRLKVKGPTTCITNKWNQLLSPEGEGESPLGLLCWNFTTMHVMLSLLPRENAVSVSFRAAASGSSSIFTSETASCVKKMRLSHAANAGFSAPLARGPMKIMSGKILLWVSSPCNGHETSMPSSPK